MIDVSDGLAQDLSHILTRSKAGAVIYEELIPLSPKAFDLSDALSSGEDFELIFTMPQMEGKKLLKRRIVNFKFIGEVVDKKYGFKLVYSSGKIKDIRLKGFSHF
jgi:thiamine-monophosphate kinase